MSVRWAYASAAALTTAVLLACGGGGDDEGGAVPSTTVTEVTASATHEIVGDAEGNDLYLLYTVEEGDTVSAIANRFGIDLAYLLAANSDLLEGGFLVPGQALFVPAANGILHRVRFGESADDIAVRYGVTVDDIIGWPGNGLEPGEELVEGDLLFVPEGSIPVSVVPAGEATPAQSPLPVIVP